MKRGKRHRPALGKDFGAQGGRQLVAVGQGIGFGQGEGGLHGVFECGDNGAQDSRALEDPR